MAKTVLQINYKLNVTREEHLELMRPLAEPIGAAEGLLWKVWLMNEADSEAGGIYLFRDAAAAQAFMESQLVADFVAHPAVFDVTAKTFEADPELSRVTRGPVDG